MRKEVKTVLKKTAKFAGVTCIAAGMFALMTSTVAVKAVTGGVRHLKDAVKKTTGEENG